MNHGDHSMWQHFSPPVGSNNIFSAHAKSSAGSCEQDADPTLSTLQRACLPVHHALITLTDELVAEKSSIGTLAYFLVLWFCTGITENERNKLN